MKKPRIGIFFSLTSVALILLSCTTSEPDPCAECERQLAEAEQRLSAVSSDLAQEGERSESLEGQLRTAQSNLDKAGRRSSRLAETLANAQDQLADTVNQLAEARAEIEHLRGRTNLAWNVPTSYEIQNLDERIQDPLHRRITQLQGVTFQNSSREGQSYKFTLDGVSNMQTLSSVQSIIGEVSQSTAVPVGLRNALLVFDSVEGGVGGIIQLRGEATEGSNVWVDFGTENLVGVPLSGDQWQVTVPPDAGPGIMSQGGNVYVLIEREGTRLYLRMNVLSGERRNVLEERLPNEVRQRFQSTTR